MEHIISILYVLNAAVVSIAYIPQMVKLQKMKSRPVNFSVMSWALWTYTSVVTVLYAFFIINDAALILVGVLNLTCVAIIFSIILYKINKYTHT